MAQLLSERLTNMKFHAKPSYKRQAKNRGKYVCVFLCESVANNLYHTPLIYLEPPASVYRPLLSVFRPLTSAFFFPHSQFKSLRPLTSVGYLLSSPDRFCL